MTAGGRPTAAVLTAAAAASLTAFVIAVVIVAANDHHDLAGRIVLEIVLVGSPVAAGLYAALSPGTERFGRVLIAVGGIWSLTLLSHADDSLLYSIGRVAAWAIFPTLVYLMLAFPHGRLSTRGERLLFHAVTGLIVVFYAGSALFIDAYPTRTPWTDCIETCPANAFMVTDRQPAFIDAFVIPFREIAGSALLLMTAVLVARRSRTGSPFRRVTLLPVLSVGVVVLLLNVAFLVARAIADGATADAIGRAWSLALPALAAAFCVGLVQRRLLIANALASLGAALRTSLEPSQIGVALRSTVGSDAVRVLMRDGDSWRWVHDGGRPVSPGELNRPGYRLRTIGEVSPVAALLVDDDLEPDGELIDGIVGLTVLTLREARLKRDLEHSLSDLDDSRKRIATAADAERRRIERDLHDGAQQRLIALRMRLALAEDMLPEDSDASEALRELEHDVDLALEEIRSLARGIYPPLLADRGIADALRSIGRRLPLRVSVRSAGLRRHTPEIESAVYYSCLEALQNVAKHASATSVTVTLRETGGIEFEIRDDGIGFEPDAVRTGAGLRNIHDRVEPLGGSVRVESVVGEGTVVSGVVPLENPDVSAAGSPPPPSWPEGRVAHGGGRPPG